MPYWTIFVTNISKSFDICRIRYSLCTNIPHLIPNITLANDFLKACAYIAVHGEWMLVTLCWRQFLVAVLVTSFGCWCPTLMLKYRGCWWRKQKQSSTSQSCRQHISSPTSVTNIDVASFFYQVIFVEISGFRPIKWPFSQKVHTFSI